MLSQHRRSEMDDRMMAGCAAFIGTALLAFFVALWPFFAWSGLWSGKTLLLAATTGFVSAAVIGFLSSRRFGVAGATGYFASAISIALFLFLRLEQVRLSALALQSPDLDYQPSLGTWLPIGWLLAAAVIAIGACRS